jgi:hypothetical protein
MTASAIDTPKFLEDFTPGQRIRTGTFIVRPELVRSFAELYDPQPMHLDPEAAKASMFGEVVGSGCQTLAITMRLLVDARLLGGTPIIGADFREIPLPPTDEAGRHAFGGGRGARIEDVPQPTGSRVPGTPRHDLQPGRGTPGHPDLDLGRPCPRDLARSAAAQRSSIARHQARKTPSDGCPA